MTYFMYDVMGEEIDEPSESEIRDILNTLSTADEEHPDVSLQLETGWSLSVYADKSVRWENVENPQVQPAETTLPSWDAIVELLLAVARGETDLVSNSFGAGPSN